jgi:hypothetical protein
MTVATPPLTARTHKMLVEVESARHAGGIQAFSAATRIILADKEATAELKVINAALIARFGSRAFSEQSNNRDRATVAARVAPTERDRLEKAKPTFEAIRRFGREQAIAECRVEVKTMNETGPLLPAITTHAKSVAEVALEMATAAPAYRNEMNKVESLAPVIWRDPEQFGALRGSDRLIDRLSSAGPERKAALAAAETASIHARFAAPALTHEFEKAIVNEEARRARMQVEVPRLSQTTATAVDGLTKLKDAVAFDATVKAMPEAVKAELRTFESSLSRRLGPNVSADDPAALASVPDQNRKSFDAARDTIKVVTRVIDTDRQQRIAQERLAQVQERNDRITR